VARAGVCARRWCGDDGVDAGEGLLHVAARLLAPGPDEGPRLLLRDVPRLGDARAAVHRLQVVAPDATTRDPRQCAQARLPGDATVLLELDDLVHHRVRHHHLHRHAERGPEAQPVGKVLRLAYRARAVDVAVTAGIGEQ